MIYKKSWKYILEHSYGKLYRPKAVKDFSDVSKGNLGGYVDGYHNLSQTGNCWIYDRVIVFGNAKVYENAKLYCTVQVYDNAQVHGDAKVSHEVEIYGNAEIFGYAKVENNACVCGNARVFENAWIADNAVVCEDAVVSGKTLVFGITRIPGRY